MDGPTPGMARALDFLVRAEARAGEEDADEPEIVCEGLACWLGTDRTNRRVVSMLLRHLLVSDSSEEGGLERCVLNDTGRAAHRRPGILPEIVAALAGGGAFTIVDDRVVPLS